MELEPGVEVMVKGGAEKEPEPKINNFGSATLGGRTGRGVGGENAEEIVHEAGLFIVICTYCLFCLEIRNFLNTNLCTVICVHPGHLVARQSRPKR